MCTRSDGLPLIAVRWHREGDHGGGEGDHGGGEGVEAVPVS